MGLLAYLISAWIKDGVFMRIQQLRELLQYVIECRYAMSTLYARLDSYAESPRVKLLLEYYQFHEKEVATQLADYIDSAPPKLLDTWYKDIIFEDFIKRCETFNLASDMTCDQVLDLHMSLENSLIELIETTASSSHCENTRNMLLNLAQVERNHLHRLVHSSLRMDDL